MSRDHWFRNTTWTAEVEADFFQRLARSRGVDRKAQYLRIQAGHLHGTGERALVEVALRLLGRLVSEYPVRFELAQAHLQRARCLADLARHEDAIVDAFRLSLDAERSFPNVKTGAWLDFGWFVVERGVTDLYAEVLAVLEEFERGAFPAFPVQSYRLQGIRAVILAERGEAEAAKREAVAGIQAASLQHSGMRHHPSVGLVREDGSRTSTRLALIAQGQLDA